MRLKPLLFLDSSQRFYLDKIIGTEQNLEILASTRDNELSIRIFIDDVIHYQMTDESFKIKFEEYMFENEKGENPPNKRLTPPHYFFEITDDSYMDWLVEESFDFFEKKYYKAYVFFFDDSVIEVVSTTEPVCSQV